MSATANDARTDETGYRHGSLRDEIALALDGALPDDPAVAVNAYRAAAGVLAEQLEPGLGKLRAFPRGAIAMVDSRFAEIGLFADGLGVELVNAGCVSDVPDAVRVVFVGCQRSPLVSSAIERWLDAGAIVITSDRSGGLASIGPLLGAGTPSGPRRARLVLDHVPGQAAGGFDLAALPVLPAVRLSPGHVPISPRTTGPDAARVLARDALTGEALAVAMPLSNGYLIHSVAHWWQCERADQTAVERRRLDEVGAFAAIGRSHPGLTLGGFVTAAAMLQTLAGGFATALGQTLDTRSYVS